MTYTVTVDTIEVDEDDLHACTVSLSPEDATSPIGIVIRFVDDDRLAGLVESLQNEGASVDTHRASHVEPVITVDPDGQLVRDGWIADMSPVCGPSFGPYATRGQALRDEREWLIENRL